MSAAVRTAPVSVLLVDDEEVIRDLARAVLERAGLEVLDEARDGRDALDRYRAQDPPERPLVVLLDNRMPGLSGGASTLRPVSEGRSGCGFDMTGRSSHLWRRTVARFG